MPPLVSILLPVRDGAATLGRARRSLAGQTFADWELIAVDDHSSDATPVVLAEWAGTDARVRVVRPGAAGLVPALAAGLAVARGAFVARMDADDEADPRRLERQLAALRADASLGLVGCRVRFGGDPVAQAGYARHVEWLNGLITPEEIALNRFVESPLAHPSVMFRRELLSQLGGYREGDFPEDYELWLRWLEAGVRMAKVPEELLVWHDSPGRLSRRDARYSPEAFFRIKAGFLAREVVRRLHGRAVWVWGAGRPTRKRAALLGTHGVRAAGYIDIDPRKAGRVIAGAPVVAPADMPSPKGALVLGYVTNPGARELIRTELRARGYAEGRDFFMAA